jgi:hypothetical protein
MADEPNMNTAGNETGARTESGDLRDQNPTLNQPSGEPNKELVEKPAAEADAGKTFLNQKAKDPADAGDKKPEGEKVDGEKKPEVAAGAPEKYEDFKLPEGYKFDDAALKDIQGLFKEAGLNQEGAQKLVDYYAKNGLQAAEAPYKLWAETQKGWIKDIEDTHGSKADTMRTDINKAIDAAITAPKLNRAFREALDLTGAGSNPAMFEALSILAKPFLEGTVVKGGGPTKESQKSPDTSARPSAAEAMYPHLIPNREKMQ